MEKKLHDNQNMPMSEDQFQAILERIEASNAGQEKYARKQYRMSQLTALASVIILAVVIYISATLIPQVHTTLQSVNYMMEDLNSVTSELAEIDLEEMIKNVDALVVSSETSIQDAMKKLNALDVETLNEAIRNLNDAVAPLANLFNRF